MKKNLLFLIALSFFGLAHSQSTIFTSSGNYIVPDGVTQIKVEAWGAGGGGTVMTQPNYPPGGGGGGAYSGITITANTGQILSVRCEELVAPQAILEV